MDTKIYKKALQDSGYKLTKQRKDILMVMIEHHDKHLSCDEIYRYVIEINEDLGIATVYRTLQLFETLNIVYRINFDDGLSRYELNTGTEDHQHHHLICLECGDVSEVKLDLLESLEHEIESSSNFTIVNHNVKFYGYCNNCGNLLDKTKE